MRNNEPDFQGDYIKGSQPTEGTQELLHKPVKQDEPPGKVIFSDYIEGGKAIGLREKGVDTSGSPVISNEGVKTGVSGRSSTYFEEMTSSGKGQNLGLTQPEKAYGTGKPERKIIRAKITND